MTAQILAPTDPRLTWNGCVGLETTDAGTTARRLTPYSRELFPSDGTDRLWNLSGMPAGVRITFVTDSNSIGGRYVPSEELYAIDLFVDGEKVDSQPLDQGDEFHFENLPSGDKQIEMWLPHIGVFTLQELIFDEGAFISAAPDTRPIWLTYGSSITHAADSFSPSQTWPAMVAQANDVNLTCLGFNGNCHLESMVARVIRDLPADYISICAGINMFRGTYAPRTFRPALIGFLSIIREKHPTTPIALISPIYSRPRETVTEEAPSVTDWTLPLMREEVKAAVEALQKHGDEAIFYVDGLQIVGPNEAHIMPDELHPDSEGQYVVAENFNKVVAGRLFDVK